MIPVVAEDGVELEFHSGGQVWLGAWHPPSPGPPPGTPHGSAALCATPGGELVFVSQDGLAWGPPGGRPEGSETLRETMEREVMEEACARVEAAALLGFSRGVCTAGPEKGLVLVRSLWYAEVALLPWDPQHEMAHRSLMRPAEALTGLVATDPFAPILRRWFREAGLPG